MALNHSDILRYWDGDCWSSLFAALLNPPCPSKGDVARSQVELKRLISAIRAAMTRHSLTADEKQVRSISFMGCRTVASIHKLYPFIVVHQKTDQEVIGKIEHKKMATGV